MAKKRTTDGGQSQSGTDAGRMLEKYLVDLKMIRDSGAGGPETSYYPVLSNLFNEVGGSLKPKVRCVMNLRNSGAGMPDGGLFTAEQFDRQADSTPKSGQLPSRGAIEIKSPREEVQAIAQSDQVQGYLNRFGLVIVANLRQFLIVQRGPDGRPLGHESFSLAGDEETFWDRIVAHPRAAAQAKGDQFIEFIRRACLHAAPLTNPKDVAWFLASYARDALVRVERQRELPALQAIRNALEEALGMKFVDEKGEHFFRSTLVQTLFYGVFSAWVRWHKDNPGLKTSFDWRTAEWSLHVPFIRTLYEEVAKPTKLEPLGLVETLDWAAAALNRVKRTEFFASFEDEHAVQYFYEPFLEAYDPALRKELGVWYTPPEIVQYQVARVDQVLREELDLPDGLADPNVVVLDPCCGTGAYLVEVLHTIARTLRDKGGDALVASDLKKAAMNRIFGFEIMPAPFVVSHMQLAALLKKEGAPLSQGRRERVGVYLTNALTGWEPPKGVKATLSLPYPELAEERDAAEKVKREKKILVVLGNPPYNGYAGVAIDEERSLTMAYRTTRKAPLPEGQGLNDLYVRFFRMAEHRIAEMSGKGIVCFISNYSWLDGRSHNGMRERYLEAFDRIWIDCLNGDKYKTGKTTPDGKSDPSVFSTQHNREGIQVGTAIALLTRKSKHTGAATVRFRHFWGEEKLGDLYRAATEAKPKRYEILTPNSSAGFPMVPSASIEAYYQWPRLVELLPISYPGVQSKQDGLVVDIDKTRLCNRIVDYFNVAISNAEMAVRHPGSMDGSHSCKPISTRTFLTKRGILQEYFVPYLYKPFDRRWIYWEPETNLLGRKSPEFFPQVGGGNLFLEARRRESVSDWSRGAVTSILADNFGNGFSNFFPMFLASTASDDKDLFVDQSCSGRQYNLSSIASEYLLGLSSKQPTAMFYHAVAIMHSPDYRKENSSSLRNDWPRIPLPDTGKAMEASAALGEKLAALLDTESPVPLVTVGKLSPLLKTIGAIHRTDGRQIDPDGSGLAMKSGWGHFGKEGVVMPGRGRVTDRAFDEDELEAISAEAKALGLSAKAARGLLGETTCDIHLNKTAYWRNIPLKVWEYHIGGYQVIKKWLSYRELEILGRALTVEEAREVMNMARRIAAILLLQPELDANYRKIKDACYDWPAKG